jgi:hypothetical protein
MDNPNRFSRNAIYKATSIDGKQTVVGHVRVLGNSYFISYYSGSKNIIVQVKPETLLIVEVMDSES